ncbi:hypothetical protein [Nonomuraea salmonea]|uniref:hypothetical protein n=1 Tax=Nonomuraea salmonea TaxID=46181 RepID=UPI002FEC67DA
MAHCLIEGDDLCEAHPAPDGDPHRTAMTEANLAAVWANYAALGYRRLIYTNTVSVLEADLITRDHTRDVRRPRPDHRRHADRHRHHRHHHPRPTARSGRARKGRHGRGFLFLEKK